MGSLRSPSGGGRGGGGGALVRRGGNRSYLPDHADTGLARRPRGRFAVSGEPHDCSTPEMRLLVLVVLLAPSLGGCKNPATTAREDAARAVAQVPVPTAREEAARALAQASAVAAQGEATIAGTVHSAGGELGTWDIALTACQSGEYDGFYGVDFYAPGSETMRVRFVHDEAIGTVVKVGIPSRAGTTLVFDRNEKCAVLQGGLEKTNMTTWTPKGKIRHLNGQVKFDCKHSQGKGHVTGDATFSHCH